MANKRVVSSRFLSVDERVTIADLDRAGHGVREIARRLSRSPATVSRELRRNRDEGRYRPYAAQRRADKRRGRSRPGKLARDPALRECVQDWLDRRWSPEQISHVLRREFPDDPGRHLAHETIYQAIYRPELGGLRRDLHRRLRTGRRCRKPRRRPDMRRSRLGNITMIDQRPAEAGDRAVPGSWEGDLIMGAGNRSAVGTLVERSSRAVILLPLPDGKSAEDVRDAVIAALAPLPPQLRTSLTWDQGTEMALHADISARLGIAVFFCAKASPWQRPSNENTNGLLRQYFPKGSDLRTYSAEQLAEVAAELNGRPRKTLGWHTPAERLAAYLTA
ncbi:MAG TPA: IS30 family transposase [Mycobacterium sp.]|nr:IS30 family transposase [Mycobacterium sp.]